MNIVDAQESASSAENYEKSIGFDCSVCGKQFSSEKGYFGHLRIHSGEVVWSCDKCPRIGGGGDGGFDSQSKLRIHENVCHTLVRPHKCSRCDDVFDRASQLDYHRRSVHLGEKSQLCPICGKGFFRKADLRTHLNVHSGVSRSICEICGRKFNHVSNLIRHCRTHAGSKPYPCTICGKRFTQISSLARHKRIHARESGASCGENRHDEVSASRDGPKVEDRKTVKRQHYCRICGESFRFMVLLRQHERLHSKYAGNCGGKSCEKNPERECGSNKHDVEDVERRNEMLSFVEDPGESSASDWRDFPAEEERVPEENVEEPAEEEPNDSLRDHLLDLDRKMNAIEIESDRDVSISISDILSPYNCDEIELSNADGLESKLYDVSGAVNKPNGLEKEYDNIVQCLNGVDFTSNIELLEASSEKTADKSSGDRPKSQSKDLKTSKSKPLASPTREDEYNKRLRRESSHMFIEFCETEYLEPSNLPALELQEIENVALFQEDFDPPEDDEARSTRANVQKIVAVESPACDENIQDVGVDNAEVTLEIGEPRLRLVQTETGKQFYEFLIDNQCTDNFESLEATDEVKNDAVSRVNVENDPALPTSGDDFQREITDDERHSNEPSCDELIETQPSTGSCREIHASSQHETSLPMVRLVQNEEGEQFFELIREPLEYERNREERIAENPGDERILEIPSNSENASASNVAKPRAPLTSSSGAKRDRKECTAENPRPAKDRARKFHCTECDKWFSTAYNFKQHAGTHFSDQQKFQCKDCGVSFAWKSTLNKHLAGNHRADGPQKFVCEICPKVYSTLSQVNEHVKRDHLKERNHVCPHCGKSFFKKFDLKTHSRTHTDERPYVCGACGKRFHHQSHIIRHERIHSGERPYACDICQRSFRQPSSLKSHRQRHRDVKIDILEYRMDEDDPLSLAVQ